jgi:hypothetical protein
MDSKVENLSIERWGGVISNYLIIPSGYNFKSYLQRITKRTHTATH